MVPKNAVPFNVPFVAPETREAVIRSLSGMVQGDGPATARVTAQLESMFSSRVLVTHSCTAALEMSVMLSGVGPGDEVIVPSFTFSSTASAAALKGGIPVFVDVDPETLNISPDQVEKAITAKTKAVIAVHYGGIPADLSALSGIAKASEICLIEDAAQSVGSFWEGRPLGTIGDFGCVSFHSTKNIQCGEGGALILNNEETVVLAEMIREKGTDRSSFLRGEVDKYTWRELGSSYLPSDLIAAYLHAQMPHIESVTQDRRDLWEEYRVGFWELQEAGRLEIVAKNHGASGNGHIFALLLKTEAERSGFIQHMLSRGIGVASHYVSLHSSPAGKKYGRSFETFDNSDQAAAGLVRLPMHSTAARNSEQIIYAAKEFLT
jgi:dTDP-4-amino-4,6-dideoxygalactose transaminase